MKLKRNQIILTALMILLITLTPRGRTFGQSNHLVIEDSRNLATHPNDYKRVLRPAFKRNAIIDLPADGTMSTIVGIKGWTDDTGGPAHELAFMNTKGILYRIGNIAAGWSDWRRVLVENAQGNVGIGTDNPRERLSVNGNIRAREIKVETNNWPDYVFQPDYVLKPLSEVEKYINENGHLPDIPTAAEVENNGLQVSDMINRLLKKNEELTLYLIQKDKEIAELEKRIKQIEIRNLKYLYRENI